MSKISKPVLLDGDNELVDDALKCKETTLFCVTLTCHLMSGHLPTCKSIFLASFNTIFIHIDF